MKSQTKENALKIFEHINFVTIATVDEHNNPWNTPVFAAYDKEHSIYWSSLEDSVHSKNIIRNGKAFIVAYSTEAGSFLGVYMKCKVIMLDETSEILKALAMLGKRRGKPFDNTEKFLAKTQQRIFKAIPLTIWMNDAERDAEGDIARDFRVQITL